MKKLKDILPRNPKPQPSKLPIRTMTPPYTWYNQELDNKGFTAILSGNERKLYGVLASHADNVTQSCFPGYELLMEEIGVKSRNVISKSIKKLEAMKLIFVEHSKGRVANLYILLNKDVWCDPNSTATDTVELPTTVLLDSAQQYQNASDNSILNDTLTIPNELKEKLEGSGEGVEAPSPLPQAHWTDSAFSGFYEEADIKSAREQLEKNGIETPTRTDFKQLLEKLVAEGKIKPIKRLNW